MAVLTPDQFKEIIIKNPNKALVAEAQKQSRDLRLHIDGTGLSFYMPQIVGFEDTALYNLRTKYTRSNKDLMAREARPLDKIYSATGGSFYTNLAGQNDNKARSFNKDIRNGMSITGWLENYWTPNYLRDPNGFILMEIAQSKEMALLMQAGKSIVYPTYKSIFAVHDYSPKGSQLDYVVLKIENQERALLGITDTIAFRCIDDANDYIFVMKDGQPTEQAEMTLPNLFNYVPAILNSDKPDSTKPGIMLSLFSDVMELCKEYLLKGSIKLTHEFLHAFPKYWEYADDCPNCRDASSGIPTGMVDGVKCLECKGTGKRIMIKVSDVKLLQYPTSKDDVVIAPNVGGYIEPSKTYFDISHAGQGILEDLISHTIWNTSASVQSSKMSITANQTTTGNNTPKTATESMMDVKPQADRLKPISEMASKRHAYILNAAIIIQISQTYPGCSVNYGQRYLLEQPDTLWDKYLGSKSKYAAVSVLDDQLIEYYESKYHNDPVKLACQVKLMKVEPFIHLSSADVKNLSVDPTDFKAKVYFGQWLSTINDLTILNTEPEQLRTLLDTFAKDKQMQQEKPLPAA